MQVWLLTSILNYGKLYRKDGVLLALHTSGASPQSSASHLLTFLGAQLQLLGEWKLSDRRLYEVFERKLLIWGNPKEKKSQADIKNMRSFCATLYFFLCCTRNPERRVLEQFAWFWASVAIQMRCVSFWDLTESIILFSYRRFGTTYRSHLQGTGR